MIFRYTYTYAALVITLLFIVLPIALCASALMGGVIALAVMYAITTESIKKLLEQCKVSLSRAKIKTLLTKVIKKNTIDI